MTICIILDYYDMEGLEVEVVKSQVFSSCLARTFSHASPRAVRVGVRKYSFPEKFSNAVTKHSSMRKVGFRVVVS